MKQKRYVMYWDSDGGKHIELVSLQIMDMINRYNYSHFTYWE
jgi:hypothetical protein